jgi:hypothetical protein
MKGKDSDSGKETAFFHSIKCCCRKAIFICAKKQGEFAQTTLETMAASGFARIAINRECRWISYLTSSAF